MSHQYFQLGMFSVQLLASATSSNTCWDRFAVKSTGTEMEFNRISSPVHLTEIIFSPSGEVFIITPPCALRSVNFVLFLNIFLPSLSTPSYFLLLSAMHTVYKIWWIVPGTIQQRSTLVFFYIGTMFGKLVFTVSAVLLCTGHVYEALDFIFTKEGIIISFTVFVSRTTVCIRLPTALESRSKIIYPRAWNAFCS